MSQKQTFIENVKRRTFDTLQSEQNILHRTKKPTTTLAIHTPLVTREDVAVEIMARIGKTVTITANTEIEKRGGFYCEVCAVELKDSNSYLDHINGKKHQSLLGMTMKAERATLNQVQDKFELLKQKMEKDEKKIDVEVRLEQNEDSEDDEPKKKKSKKKKNKQQDNNVEDIIQDPEMLAMGYNFTFGKK